MAPEPTQGITYMGDVWEHQIQIARRILEGWLKTHGQSLNNKALRTLMVEVESIISSRPLTVETLGDINSQIPLPSNLLTMKVDNKRNIVMSPAGVFTKPDLYSRRRWRCVQNRGVLVQMKKRISVNFTNRQKWADKRRNFEVVDILILKRTLLST